MSGFKERNLIIIGISGVTCGGKTTTATQLNNILPNSKIFSQDDYYLNVEDPRHIWIPELNHINFDVLSSLNMEKMHDDVLKFINNNNLRRMKSFNRIEFGSNGTVYNRQKFIHDKFKESDATVLIIEGFSIFNFKPMLRLFDLKYYFMLKKHECFRRRKDRVYEPPDCPGYFEKCVWPEHLSQLNEVRKTVEDVTYFNEKSGNVVDKILSDILEYL